MQEIDLIGYCGLDCSNCWGFKLTVSEAAKSLRRELRTAKFKLFWEDIPFLGKYESFKKALDGLAKLRCPRACRGGGGNPFCKIRSCCKRKGFIGCWECSEFEKCEKLKILEKVHKKEHISNLKKMKKYGKIY